MRPTDWFLVDLAVDPTPGDAFGIRQLAGKYADIATVAGDAAVGIRHARSSGASSAWVGDAGDIFREKSERMPGELSKANDSYQQVADALTAWATALDDAQAQADRGLQHAREAHADLTSARGALAAAQLEWTTVTAQQLTYQRLQKIYANVPPPPGVTLPSASQLRSVERHAQSAQASIAAANTHIADANARLDAARAMVLEAKALRDDAERRTVHAITEAGDRAVKASSIWEAIQDSAAWQATVQIATVVLTVLSIVFMIIGGPLVWALIIAASILLIVDALMSIAQGKNAWLELSLVVVGLIPGGRVIGMAGRGVETLGRIGVAGEHMASSINAIAGAVRAGSNSITHVVGLAGEGLADFASIVPNGVLKAVHAGSADAPTLQALFAKYYKGLLEVNYSNYLTGAEEFRYNCTRCVIATEHVLAGEPRVAEPIFTKGAPFEDVVKHFGQTLDDVERHFGYDSIVKKMTDLGEGSRGIIYGARSEVRNGQMVLGTAHVFNVIHDENGIVFLDSQCGRFATLEPFAVIGLLITKGL
jgi:uncharacterized protein YukE